MSLKQNIEMVKESLSAEEQFFEKAVVTERFIKKYKNGILAVVAIAIIVAVTNVAYDINSKRKKDVANSALNALLENRNNQNSLSELKASSSELYELFKYKDAINTKNKEALAKIGDSSALIINDLAKYEKARDVDDLKKYIQNDGAIYKDLAALDMAVMLLKDNKVGEAHEVLNKISKDSSLKQLANALLHYGVDKN